MKGHYASTTDLRLKCKARTGDQELGETQWPESCVGDCGVFGRVVGCHAVACISVTLSAHQARLVTQRTRVGGQALLFANVHALNIWLCSAVQRCRLSAQDRYDLRIEPGGTCETSVLTTSTAKPSGTPSPKSSAVSAKASGTTPAPPTFKQGTICLFVCDYGYYYSDAANVKMQCNYTEDKTEQFGKWEIVKLIEAATTTTTTTTMATTTKGARRRVLKADTGDSWRVVGDALGQCKSA